MKFARKRAADQAGGEPTEQSESGTAPVVVEPPAGPVDISEVDEIASYVDLGSILLQPPTDLDLRLQVEEDTGTVMNVLLVGSDGALEMRAFAAARGGDLWADARRQIAADAAGRGGTATEQEGPFGIELFCQVPVTGPDGQGMVQPSRVIGASGPRWFIRATVAGQPALDAEAALPYENAFRAVAVRRGNHAMAPGEPLPLRLPPEAQPQSGDEAVPAGD